ncbi:unnamed protein product [Polarella glacialis]|uniref:Aspartyl/asparaginy/proline hydroxylase domain-containing protein n=1 Tax=Polarella glacialis TaxID=89957 RepID=A0A813JCL6_POLGL|nr:unnamed protein product [Polarella glacialis]
MRSVLAVVVVAVCSRAQSGDFDIQACVAQFPECLDILSSGEEEQQETLAVQLLQSWLQRTEAQGDGDAELLQSLRREAFARLQGLASAASAKPSLALGVGQVLHSFFFWGLSESDSKAWPKGPSAEVMYAALQLHELALQHAGCDSPEVPREAFLLQKCPWRWRFVLLLGSELGLHLATGLQDFGGASSQFRRTADHVSILLQLPFFRDLGEQAPMRFNQNWDYFPDAQHWPIWPRESWPSFGGFLEEHYGTFRASLEALLAADPDGLKFGSAARFQSGLTPRNLDWSRLKLIHGGGESELCQLPFMKESCRLLSQRPEIGPRCGTFLSGASLARLLPGAELKPHFGTHPRLTVHLGLRTPVGASLTVGGEEVFWKEGRSVVFDDTYMHKVRHRGDEARYVLVAWFCHPCDLGWRQDQGEAWQGENPLPPWCGSGGPGFHDPPVPGYGESV